MGNTYIIVSMVVSPIISGVIVYYIQSRIRINESKAQTTITAEMSPLAALSAGIAVRDQAMAVKEAEAKQERDSHETFMQGLIAKFQEQQEKLTNVLTGIDKRCEAHFLAITDLRAELLRHSEESTKGRGLVHARLNDVQMQIAQGTGAPAKRHGASASGEMS